MAGRQIMESATPIRNSMLASVPTLRVFAMRLCRNADRADDLVQKTLAKALANIHSFRPGSNMSAWLCTILHNQFRSEYRKLRREIEDRDGVYAESMISPPEQISRLEFEEVWRAFKKLPTDQQEVLILVCSSGLSYAEAAEIVGCPVGTVKSRISRARTQLAAILSIGKADYFSYDGVTHAVFARSSFAHV
jgi:RNA polymerase sigma-70 factor, ECF subfamily